MRKLFDDNIWYIYRSYHTKEFSLIVFPFPSRASFKTPVIPTALHPALMISFSFSGLRWWYISVITLAWRSFKVDKRMSALMVETSRSGPFVRAYIIQGVKYSLKGRFSYFLKDAFVVESNGCSKWDIFFGTMTDSIL